ncbi:embryonal Fyn-associated substrate isoform X2 [Alligator mississippiensis]|uniref:embryonal Fyn-associated substrate isoform X2 n=1 Tax=Alligator mississippiensis TaxID=8496 RepID=UPI00090729D6|nr:embryonal Fyn-associated substrate isoform X2 [Alligator mississippiensis]
MCARLARALYDNVAECPEELSFRRGDLLVLLQPAAPGPAGWHLCALHGQPGIVPANRVRLLPEPGPLDPSPGPTSAGLHEGPGRRSHEPPEDKKEEEEQGVYVVPPPARPCPLPLDAIYNVPRGARRDGDPGEVYAVPSSLPSAPYDLPPTREGPEGQEGEQDETYAAPPGSLRRAPALPDLYEAPEDVLGGEGGIYDLPGPPPVPALAPAPAPALERALGALGLGEGGRPRLPSAESLSRRPLPALPSPGAPRRSGSIQARPLPPPPAPAAPLAPPGLAEGDGPNEYEGIRLPDEYDYVHLKGTDRSQPPNMDQPTPKDLLGPGIEPETPPLPKEEEEVPRPGPEDAQLLQFYAGQCQGHYTALQAAMAALLTSAEAQEPPGTFVPHGKRVIVTAHKLVFVGDTLARLASSAPVRAHVGAAAGALCQALREAVLAVKGAALSYPSASAARLLRQRVAELARRALAFTSLLGALAPS